MENIHHIDIPATSAEELEQAFPGGFSLRDEANALTAYAFRNGSLETLHSGKHSPLIEDPALSRITNEEMKKLMIEASERLESLLRLRETNPGEYQRTTHDTAIRYCRKWKRA